MHPNNWQEFTSIDSDFEVCMIGVVGNHLLVKMNWSDHGQNNSNARATRPAVGYFQRKYDNVISYIGMNLILNSIKKGAAIRPIDQILSPPTIHDHLLTVTSHNSQQSKDLT